MRQFIHGSETAFADLERRARHACVTFPNQDMPRGATPPTARVGFEINPSDGSAILLIDRGIAYVGPNAGVQEWLSAGQKQFPSFAQLRRWLQDELRSSYESPEMPALSRPVSPAPVTPLRPEELTDLDAVQSNLREPAGPLYLDESALLNQLTAHVRGQDDALRTLTRAVCRHLARRSPARPATLFAVGPTGVGKTKTAESLPLALQTLDPGNIGYGYLRLDMSEYQERYRVSQLLGSPQGYVGYGEGAQLADALAANPRTIVLFDEIEKAHPDVLRALMNAMDAGRLSTAQRTERGRELDCRRAIFMFTSNLEASSILRDLEQRNAFGNPAVADEVCRRHLRGLGIKPELIGRIQRFLVFRPLSTSTRAEIMGLAIARVGAEYGVQVGRIAPGVIVAILNRAQSDGFGARPDEYLVDEMLGTAFIQAAARIPSPVEIRGGPPFECVPLDGTAGAHTGLGSEV